MRIRTLLAVFLALAPSAHAADAPANLEEAMARAERLTGDHPAFQDRQLMRLAMDLTRELRLDELHQNLTRNMARKSLAQKRISESQAQCYEAKPLSVFTANMTRNLAREFTFAELETALALYRSAAGSRFMRMSYQYLWKKNPEEFPLDIGGAKQTIKLSEWFEVMQFNETPMGQRVGTTAMGVFLNSFGGLVEPVTLMIELKLECEAPR